MDILFSLRAQGRRTSRIPALVALLLLFAWILFIVLAQTTTLLFIATVAAFAVLAAFSGRAIRRVLGGALVAALFSLLLVLPAFFLSTGGGRALFLPWKSFLTMAGVMMLAESLMWHDVTRALARLRVPETVIFLLDTMLRSLYMLGLEAGRLLLALKLRSIGRNRQKSRAMGGVLGSLYLQAGRLSQATYEAMRCRGFVGTYKPPSQKRGNYGLRFPMPPPLGEVPRRGGEGNDVSKFSNAPTLSVTLVGDSSPKGGAMGITDRSSKELLTFTDVCFAYDNVPSLVHVTFTIRRGDTVAILGPNGAGKSTLLSLLNGIHFPETGRYLFEGTEITAEKMREHRYSKWFHQRVGFIWQDPGAMLFCPTVEEELAFGPQQMGLDETLVQERVKDALGFFNIAHLCGRAPYTLSGGEKRRVAMAAIFTVNPAVWTFDEPTANLDDDGLESLQSLLRELRAAGKTIIFSTHDEAFAHSFATKILHVHKDHTVTVENL